MSTKINILSSLLENADNLVIVGAMANNFLKFKGVNVGASLIEKGSENTVKNINTLAEKNKCKLIIPVDCNTSSNVNGDPVYKSLKDMGSEDMILDIGKNTIDLIKTTTAPIQYFGMDQLDIMRIKFFNWLSIHSKKIAENTKSKSLISIVGGGDTVAAIKNTGLENVFTHLSTAGGAFLECLEGKELPGIKVLTRSRFM